MGGAVAAWACVALLALPAAAKAGELSLTTGVGYATGTYGANKSTDTTLVPLGAKYRIGGFAFGVTAEWVSVDGPADVGDLEGAAASGGGGHGKRDRSGFRDTHVSAKYAFNHIGGGPFYLDMQARAALSTASEGSGSARYITDAEFGAEWRGAGLYIDLGRRFMNDSAIDRRDAWTYATGGWARLDRRTELGMWYSTHEAPVLGQPEPRKLGAYIARDLKPTLRLSFSLYEGLSPASPDYGGGLRLTWRPDFDFRRRPFEE